MSSYIKSTWYLAQNKCYRIVSYHDDFFQHIKAASPSVTEGTEDAEHREGLRRWQIPLAFQAAKH